MIKINGTKLHASWEGVRSSWVYKVLTNKHSKNCGFVAAGAAE